MGLCDFDVEMQDATDRVVKKCRDQRNQGGGAMAETAAQGRECLPVGDRE